jgi:redox-sensing transcriptional repressor
MFTGSKDMKKMTPSPTLRRLAIYHHFLKQLQQTGRDVISCTHIAKELRLDPTQVRKDIEVTSIVGKSRVGYEIDPLINAIETFLGWHNTTDAFLAGAGHMGYALMGYDQFQNLGLNLIAAFDNDEAKVGQQFHGREILHIDKLKDLALSMKVMIGIITVPGDKAQEVADLMIAGGIRAIWNFAPSSIIVPENIVLENVRLSSSLAVLSNKLNHMLNNESKQKDSEDAASSNDA